MVANNSVARNYGLLALTVLAGLIGVSCRWRCWGVLFIVPLAGAIMALGYIVSYYLNAIVDSRHRATVLSFKGVAFNLGYGVYQSHLCPGTEGRQRRRQHRECVGTRSRIPATLGCLRLRHLWIYFLATAKTSAHPTVN
jgi:hypothetical protein